MIQDSHVDSGELESNDIPFATLSRRVMALRPRCPSQACHKSSVRGACTNAENSGAHE
jgi:hypothetical protein